MGLGCVLLDCGEMDELCGTDEVELDTGVDVNAEDEVEMLVNEAEEGD